MSKEQEKELDKAVTFLRGKILSDTVEIERKVDNFLSLYFCSTDEKKNELCELLLFTERITFDIKKQMMYAILQNHYKPFLIENPDLIAGLEELIPHRNIFAHLEVDKEESFVDGESENQKVVFKRYKGGKNKPITYTIKDVTKIGGNMGKISKLMDYLVTAMPPLV